MPYVYLIKENARGSVKIGMTKNNTVYNRLQSMETYCPLGCELVHIIQTDKPRSLEKELHKKFEHKRLKGEFFNLDELDIDLIKNSYSEELTITDSELFLIQSILQDDNECNVKKLRIKKMLKSIFTYIEAPDNKKYSELDNVVKLITEHYSSKPLTENQSPVYLSATELCDMFNYNRTNSISKRLKELGYHREMKRDPNTKVKRAWFMYPKP